MAVQKKAILIIQQHQLFNFMCLSSEELFKILANPTRRAILNWLKDPEVSFATYTQLYEYRLYGVCASLIQHKAGLSQPATSLSLKILLDAKLLTATRVGKWTYFKRNTANLEKVIEILLKDIQSL